MTDGESIYIHDGDLRVKIQEQVSGRRWWLDLEQRRIYETLEHSGVTATVSEWRQTKDDHRAYWSASTLWGARYAARRMMKRYRKRTAGAGLRTEVEYE